MGFYKRQQQPYALAMCPIRTSLQNAIKKLTPLVGGVNQFVSVSLGFSGLGKATLPLVFQELFGFFVLRKLDKAGFFIYHRINWVADKCLTNIERQWLSINALRVIMYPNQTER
jgi:hypothetical protein